jgi:hypothetical protein
MNTAVTNKHQIPILQNKLQSIEFAKHFPVSMNFVANSIKNVWHIESPDVRTCLQDYFLLYHSAHHIRETEWKEGTILRDGILYLAIFYGDCNFSRIKFSDPKKQFALSFRNPVSQARNSYIQPIVLIADPETISLSGRHLTRMKHSVNVDNLTAAQSVSIRGGYRK